MPISVKIVNVVATATLDRRVDLEALVGLFPHEVSYDLDVYWCAYFKSKGMGGKVSIFVSGKMISIGTKNEKDAKQDLIFVAKRLQQVNVAKLKDPPKIQNMVAVINLDQEIDLEELVLKLHGAIYKPEIFPALTSKFGGVSCHFFSSGKVVCAGLKSINQLPKIQDILKSLRLIKD